MEWGGEGRLGGGEGRGTTRARLGDNPDSLSVDWQPVCGSPYGVGLLRRRAGGAGVARARARIIEK